MASTSTILDAFTTILGANQAGFNSRDVQSLIPKVLNRIQQVQRTQDGNNDSPVARVDIHQTSTRAEGLATATVLSGAPAARSFSRVIAPSSNIGIPVTLTEAELKIQSYITALSRLEKKLSLLEKKGLWNVVQPKLKSEEVLCRFDWCFKKIKVNSESAEEKSNTVDRLIGFFISTCYNEELKNKALQTAAETAKRTFVSRKVSKLEAGLKGLGLVAMQASQRFDKLNIGEVDQFVKAAKKNEVLTRLCKSLASYDDHLEHFRNWVYAGEIQQGEQSSCKRRRLAELENISRTNLIDNEVTQIVDFINIPAIPTLNAVSFDVEFDFNNFADIPTSDIVDSMAVVPTSETFDSMVVVPNSDALAGTGVNYDDLHHIDYQQNVPNVARIPLLSR